MTVNIRTLAKYSLEVNKYRLIHGHFHIGLVIIPRPQYGSRDDNHVNMEMPMY